MARDITGRIKVVPKIANINTRATKSSDGKQGIIIWNADKIIQLYQIDNNNRTSCSSTMTMETVDPDHMSAYLQSMLDNGWTIKEGLNISLEDFT